MTTRVPLLPLSLAALALAAALLLVLDESPTTDASGLSPGAPGATREPVLADQEHASGLPRFAALPPLDGQPFARLDAPPGLVPIPGGRFTIGADVAEITSMIQATGYTVLGSETPSHTVELADFALMPTEVTNEQFLAFVEATGAKPPQHWAAESIGAAGLAYATKLGTARKQALDEGQPLPQFEPFDRATWWAANWSTSAWAVPAGLEAYPVVFVDSQDASAYARWAGLRLMSEEQFQAAGRGTSRRSYPWGDEPDPERANTLEAQLGGPEPVGSFPSGAVWIDADTASAAALFDLGGNVWEWTRSPFTAYPNFEPLEVRLPTSGKAERLVPDFEAAHFTAVGGGFNSPMLTARLTTRRNTLPTQATSALGFRCSAPAAPLDPTCAIARWSSERGTAVPPTYRVITGFDQLRFIPAETLEAGSLAELETLAAESGIMIGTLTTSVPLTTPALEPGSFSITWHPSGVLRFHDALGDSICELECAAPQLAATQGSRFIGSKDLAKTERVDLMGQVSSRDAGAPAFNFRMTFALASDRFSGEWSRQ